MYSLRIIKFLIVKLNVNEDKGDQRFNMILNQRIKQLTLWLNKVERKCPILIRNLYLNLQNIIANL